MRGTFVRLHRILGLATAGFLALAGLTGSVIAFQPELDSLLNPHMLRVNGGEALPASMLAASAERSDARMRVSSIAFSPDPRDTRMMWVEPKVDPATGQPFNLDYNQVFVDPGTGHVLGKRDYGAMRLDRAHLIPFLYTLHYSLHLPNRLGVWLMGVVALAWAVDCFVGFYLTLPRGGPFLIKWRTAWAIRWHARSYRFNFDLHRAFGLWLWPVLFTVAVSSIHLNLDREIFTPAVRLFSPISPGVWASIDPRRSSLVGRDIGWDGAIARARLFMSQSAEGWDLRWVYRIPDRNAYVIDLGEPGRTGRGLRYEQIAVDAGTGAILARRGYAEGTAGDTFIAWQYPLHSGQVGGLPGRILICLTGIVVTMLSITGIYLWWRKRASRNGRVHAIRSSRKNERPLACKCDGLDCGAALDHGCCDLVARARQ